MSLQEKTLAVRWHDAEMRFEVSKTDLLSLPEVTTYGKCIADSNEFLAVAAEELPNEIWRGVTLIPKSLIIGKPQVLGGKDGI